MAIAALVFVGAVITGYAVACFFHLDDFSSVRANLRESYLVDDHLVFGDLRRGSIYRRAFISDYKLLTTELLLDLGQL